LGKLVRVVFFSFSNQWNGIDQSVSLAFTHHHESVQKDMKKRSSVPPVLIALIREKDRMLLIDPGEDSNRQVV